MAYRITIAAQEGANVGILLRHLRNVVGRGRKTRSTCVTVELPFEARPYLPVAFERVDLGLRHAAEHGGVHVPAFGGRARVHIARDVEVIVVGTDLVDGNQAAELVDGRVRCHGVNDTLDVTCPQLVVLALFHEVLGGVHHQDVARLALLAEHHDNGRDTGAEEDIGRKSNDCLNMAVLHQVLANGALLTAAEQHAMGQNDAHDAVGAQVV